MSHGIYSALSGAVAQETLLETTANNLANASTTGYQASRVVFHEALARAAAGQPGLRFSEVSGTVIDLSPGELRETGRPLDIALAPGDFLAVSTPRGERYTRAGGLSLGADGILRASSGDPILREDGKPARAAAGAALTIGTDGALRAGGAPAGRLRIVSFPTPAALERDGGPLLGPGGAGAPAPSAQRIRVGVLEGSNASPVRGMTELLQSTRLFEAFQRAIEAFHEADQKVISTVPR